MFLNNYFNDERAFSGTYKLYGGNLAKESLKKNNILIIGIGGVGSWAVESLVRSGIVNLTIVDMDHIVESNINRQIHSTISNLGRSKVEAMKDRIKDINPFCIVDCIDDFISIENIENILSHKNYEYIIDCTDDIQAKIALILYAKKYNIFLLSCGATGGKTDSLLIKYGDISQSKNDPLLSKLRNILRRKFNFPKPILDKRGKILYIKKMKINVLWIDQPLRVSDCEPEIKHQRKISRGLSCSGYGSTVTVTSTMGIIASGIVLNKINKI